MGLNVKGASMDSMEGWRSKITTAPRESRSSSQQRWVLCMLTYWFIWKTKGKTVFEDRTPKPIMIVQEILRAYEEINATSIPNPRPESSARSRRWEKLDEGIIKVNCDAVWYSASR